MFCEYGVCLPVIGEIADAEAIVGYEPMQRDREVTEKGPRLKLPFQRLPNGFETGEDLRFRLDRPGVQRGGIHGHDPAGILTDNPVQGRSSAITDAAPHARRRRPTRTPPAGLPPYGVLVGAPS